MQQSPAAVAAGPFPGCSIWISTNRSGKRLDSRQRHMQRHCGAPCTGRCTGTSTRCCTLTRARTPPTPEVGDPRIILIPATAPE